MPECRSCDQKLYWPSPYRKGSKPVEKDGTAHFCGGSNTFTCKYCPSNKVKGTAKEIDGHTKIYHPNGERIELDAWLIRFHNLYIKKSKKQTLNKEKHINSRKIV